MVIPQGDLGGGVGCPGAAPAKHRLPLVLLPDQSRTGPRTGCISEAQVCGEGAAHGPGQALTSRGIVLGCEGLGSPLNLSCSLGLRSDPPQTEAESHRPGGT